MATTPYLMGIDLGTTTCRCAIFDLGGNEIAAAYGENVVRYPRPLWAEVEPEAWWRCVVLVIRQALERGGVAAQSIAAIGLSGLMHAPVLLDVHGQPLAPAMLWMDQRCAPQCEAMRREDQSVGLLMSTTLSAPKLRWIAETAPDILARTHSVVLPKDFIRFRLTGATATDISDASGTGLFDRERLIWDAAAVRLARISPEILPAIHPSWAKAGAVSIAASHETGLAHGTPVAVGGGDTFCTLLGVGEFRSDEVCMYLGTAAWIARIDGVGSDGRPLIGSFGATATTGAALRWIRDLLACDRETPAGASYELLTQQAAEIAPGADGLFFLPHMMGERGPEADPLARGTFAGLTLSHTRAHMVRAVLEGIAFHLRRLLEAQTAAEQPERRASMAVACGGVARSSLFVQLLADITSLAVRVPAVAEAGVLGAALLGGFAAGLLERESARSMSSSRQYRPDEARTLYYERLYRRYCTLDDLLTPWHRAADEETA